MNDLFELTPEVLLEQSQEMQSLCAAYEALFGNIMSDLAGINENWSDLLSNNFSGKIGSAQKAFSGALAMLRNSANSARSVAETAREMDTAWASKLGGTDRSTDNTSWTQTLLSTMGMDPKQRTAYLGETKDLLDALKKLEEKYEDNVPPSVQAWIDLLWGKTDKAYFDKSFGKVSDITEVFEKLAEEDYRGAFKTGGKTILKEVFGEAVKGTAGEAVSMFGYKYDPSTKYYINMGLGIGEGLGEFAQDPSLENLTEIAWNASAKAVLETAGSSIETMTRLIPGISEYYYDEHGAEDIGDAAGVALGDLYAMFTPDEGIKEYASNYYKDGMWEGLWGGFEDIGNFVEESGGAGEAAKRFFDTAAKDGQEAFDHVIDNAKHLWNGIHSWVTGEVISTSKPVGGSGGGGGASFDQSGGGGAAF